MSDPVSLADFWSQLPLLDVTLWPDVPGEESETAGGDYLAAVFGTGMWRGRVELRDMRPTVTARVMALFEDIDSRRGSFLAYAWPKCGPAADPAGTILGGATPELHTIDAGRREIRISGLPVGYTISAGDMVAFQYGADPVRHALHRASSGAVAAGTGITPLFRLSTPVRTGAQTGTAVTLVRAAAAFRIRPGSIQRGRLEGGLRSGVGFDMVQVLG